MFLSKIGIVTINANTISVYSVPGTELRDLICIITLKPHNDPYELGTTKFHSYLMSKAERLSHEFKSPDRKGKLG